VSCSRAGFIVTNLPKEPDYVVWFYNRRGTAEQHINECKYAFHWTRLSYPRSHVNEMRLQLHALAYNLATCGHVRLVFDKPPAQADQDLGPCRLQCPAPLPSNWPK
jgi:hypothetical protein